MGPPRIVIGQPLHVANERDLASVHSETQTILVVDDEKMQRDTLSLHLRRHGFIVTPTQSGDQALEAVRNRRPDLVLLDIQLPGLSGFDILRTLRQTYSATELPIIMATVRDESRSIVDALKFGANDYVTKPFDFPVVLARVQTQLSLKRSVDRIVALEEKLARRNQELEATNLQLAAANRQMKRDLEAAARVQQALLPSALPEVPGVTFAMSFRPCAELAGDLLDVVQVDDQQVSLYVLDVVGHGVAAALLAVTVNRVLAHMRLSSSRPGPLDETPKERHPISPAHVAARLSTEFAWNPRTEQFFTLLHGMLDLQTHQFRFVSAGHPGPIYFPRDADPEALDVPGFPIGVGDGNYDEISLSLQPGDRLYLFSDGLPDAMSASDKRFGLQRIIDVLNQSRGAPLNDGLNDLLRTIDEWRGERLPYDDISLLAIEIAGRKNANGD
jgi:sigma-B regulation protein RsbU (phosphoserine phosphatase)